MEEQFEKLSLMDNTIEEVPNIETNEETEMLVPFEVPHYLDILKKLVPDCKTYDEFVNTIKETSNSEDTLEIIEEIDGDLFGCDSSWSLAHCVSQDLAMFKGIAVEFKRRFQNVEFLRKQQQEVGQVALLQHGDGRFIFYLITKSKFYAKPTFETIYLSLQQLKHVCLTLNVDKLAMPKIGSGLDRLDFDKVKFIIRQIFNNSGIHVRIYNYTPSPINIKLSSINK